MNSTSGPHALTKSQVYQQPIAIMDRDGQVFEIPLFYIDSLVKDAVKQGIIPAVQFGVCIMLSLVLMLLSKREKRFSPVFIFNTAALLFNIVWAILQCCVVTSSFWDVYPILTGDVNVSTPAARRLSAGVAIFVNLVTVCIEASLVLQVHVVSITLRTRYKVFILAISAFVALVAVGFRLATTIVGVRCIFSPNQSCANTFLIKAKDVSLTVSICFFSAIFCAKLGWSLRERRKLGMKQFGSMQIIFIGGFQTMIVPAIFSLIQFVKANKIPNIGSNILTVTCISLPLTSLWASSHADSASKVVRGHDNFHRRFLGDSSTADSNARKPSYTSEWPPSQLTSRSTARDRLGVLASVDSQSDGSSWGKLSPGAKQIVSVRDVDRDLEMQELKDRE